MALEIESFAEDFDPRFKIFHELMARKIRDILLVSTPYDAWILEEDCRLSERIINEYRGLNLSNPPRFTWVSTAQEALAALDKKKFDMVISMSQLADMDVFALGQEIKKKAPDLPVVLGSTSVGPPPRTPFLSLPEEIAVGVRGIVWTVGIKVMHPEKKRLFL